MPGPSPGLCRALLGLWAALGLGLFRLSGKSRVLAQGGQGGGGAPGPDKRPQAPPGSALVSLYSHASAPPCARAFPSIPLPINTDWRPSFQTPRWPRYLPYPLRDPGCSSAPISCPGDPVSPLSLSGVPLHALLCSMVHGLTSSSVVVRKDPISPTAVTQRRYSRSIRSPGNRVPQLLPRFLP